MPVFVRPAVYTVSVALFFHACANQHGKEMPFPSSDEFKD